MKLPIGELTGLTIELNTGTDTYEVQGYKGRGVRFHREGELMEFVYFDQLKTLFTKMTGLAVSL
jgi:hypothetical protein